MIASSLHPRTHRRARIEISAVPPPVFPSQVHAQAHFEMSSVASTQVTKTLNLELEKNTCFNPTDQQLLVLWCLFNFLTFPRRFSPARDPPTPQKLESIFSAFFCSLEFSRDRHCHGTRKCPHRLSSEKLLRVAVPSQLRVSLHAWRLLRRFKNASKLWRRCSTPPHAQHAGPHTYMPTVAAGTPTRATHH